MDSGSHVISHTNCAHTMAGRTNPHPSTPFGCVGRFVGFSHSQHGRRGSVRGPPWRAGGALFPELRTVCIFLGGACAAGGSAGCCVRSVFLSVVGGPALFVALLGVHTHTHSVPRRRALHSAVLYGAAHCMGDTHALSPTPTDAWRSHREGTSRRINKQTERCFVWRTICLAVSVCVWRVFSPSFARLHFVLLLCLSRVQFLSLCCFPLFIIKALFFSFPFSCDVYPHLFLLI